MQDTNKIQKQRELTSLITEKEILFNENELKCNLCGKSGFSNHKALAGHKSHHSKLIPNNNKVSKIPKTKQSQKSKVVSTSKPVTIKIPRLRKIKPKQGKDCYCNDCNKQCESIQGLRAHQRGIQCKKNKLNLRKRKRKEIKDNASSNKKKIKKEKNIIVIDDNYKAFKCECGKTWETRQQLRTHQTKSQDAIHKKYVTRNCAKPEIIMIEDTDDDDDHVQEITKK